MCFSGVGVVNLLLEVYGRCSKRPSQITYVVVAKSVVKKLTTYNLFMFIFFTKQRSATNDLY